MSGGDGNVILDMKLETGAFEKALKAVVNATLEAAKKAAVKTCLPQARAWPAVHPLAGTVPL